MGRGLKQGVIRGREAVGKEAIVLTLEGDGHRGNKGAAETDALDRFGKRVPAFPPTQMSCLHTKKFHFIMES